MFVKSYCNLRMEYYKGKYYVIDKVTQLVKAKGTKAECEDYFRQHTREV